MISPKSWEPRQFLGVRSKIRLLNGREPSADDRVLKQKGSLPITKFTQALALFETLIAGGSRRNRDYSAPGPRLADMGSDPRGQSGPRFGEDIHFATGMSRDRLLSCSRQIDAVSNDRGLVLTAAGLGVPVTAHHNVGPPCGFSSTLASRALRTQYGLVWCTCRLRSGKESSTISQVAMLSFVGEHPRSSRVTVLMRYTSSG